MDLKIAVIKGDGIGPEIINETIKVLNIISNKYNHKFHYKEALAGGVAIDTTGVALPDETLEICKSTQALLFGAVGGPKWDNLPGKDRPEQGLLKLRKELGLYANLRPAVMFDELKHSCPLRPDLIEGGLDIMIIRELTGGIYFGRKYTEGDKAVDTMEYHKYEIERIAHKSFQISEKRNKKIISIDKANVLETSRLWRKTFEEIAMEYTHVELKHMYVDNAAMQLVVNPKQFDVIATENMFGDILSDEASTITGSIGLLPSAALGNDYGMYEPIHGSAPDIAGQGIANPIAAILSAAMMLKYSFNLQKESESIENAVKKALSKGYRTKDIAQKDCKLISTSEMGDVISGIIGVDL